MHKRALFEGWGDLISTAQAFDWEPRGGLTLCQVSEMNGGEGGIRTPVTLPGKLDFESSAFNRARPPLRFLCLAFLQPKTREKVSEHGRRLFCQHAAGCGQLMIEPLILT